MSKGWSVDTMTMSRTPRGNSAGTGSASMTMHGSNIGIAMYTMRGRLGVVMTAGGRGASATLGWSVDAGSVSRVRASNRAGTGSASMTVHGASMGSLTYSGRDRYGKTGCETTEWASETSVRCLLGHGAGGTRLYVMTVGQRIGCVSKGWSVDTMTVSRARRGNRAGTGSASMTMHGSSMGIVRCTVRGRLGHTGCEGTDWQSETSVRCQVGHGAAGTRRVVMTAGGRGASATCGYSIDRVSLSRFSNSARLQIFSLTDCGLRSFFLRMSAMARQGQSASACTIWISNTILVCRSARGSGGSGAVLITAAHQGGTMSQAVAFDFGIVSALQLSNGPVSFSTAVQFVSFLGAGFRIVAFSLFARNGGSSCQASMWSSDTSMLCRAALGTNNIFRTVLSIAATSTSTSDAFSHDVCIILFADALGERSVTITGRSFGGSAGDIRVVVGVQNNGGGIAALRGVGLQEHRTLVFILPYMNLKDFPGGVFLLQSVRVVLDGRNSRPSMPSLLFHLALDYNYDKVRKSTDNIENFKKVLSNSVMSIELGEDSAESSEASTSILGEAQLQQVLVMNITRGSTIVEFHVLNSADGSWFGAKTVHIKLVASYAKGVLAASLLPLANVTQFYAEGYMIPTASTTTITSPTTMVATTTTTPLATSQVQDTNTTHPSKSFFEDYEIALIGAGAGLAAMCLFSGLFLLIRRSLKWDEDFLKQALMMGRSTLQEEIPQNLALVTSSQEHLIDWQNRHKQHLLNSEDPVDPMPLISPRTSLNTARTVDRMDLGGESSGGTARSGNEADDAPSPLFWTSSQHASGGGGSGGARGGEEGSEFAATQSKVPMARQVRSRLMPDVSDSMRSKTSIPATPTVSMPQRSQMVGGPVISMPRRSGMAGRDNKNDKPADDQGACCDERRSSQQFDRTQQFQLQPDKNAGNFQSGAPQISSSTSNESNTEVSASQARGLTRAAEVLRSKLQGHVSDALSLPSEPRSNIFSLNLPRSQATTRA